LFINPRGKLITKEDNVRFACDKAEERWYNFFTDLLNEGQRPKVRNIRVLVPFTREVCRTKAIQKRGRRRLKTIDYGDSSWLYLESPVAGLIGSDRKKNSELRWVWMWKFGIPWRVNSIAMRAFIDHDQFPGTEIVIGRGFVEETLRLLEKLEVPVDRECFIRNCEAYQEKLVRSGR
jgi:hypothetical protein